jgi:O-antigen/teichoic acid export membrane protein
LLFVAGSVFIGISLLLISLLGFFPAIFLPLFSGRTDLPFFYWSLLFLALQLPSFLIEYLYLLLQKPWRIVGYGVVSFSAQLLAVLLPVIFGGGVGGVIICLALVALGKCLLLVQLMTRHARSQWDSRLLRKWLYLSLPLVLYGLIGGFMQTFNNWLVNFHFHGDERLFALFRYGAREFPLALALADGLNAAMIPEIAKNLELGLEKIKDQQRRLMHTLYPLTLFLLLTSKWWFPAVFSSAYVDSVPVFNAFLLLLISRIVFTRTILSGMQDNNITLWISGAELATNVLLGFWWIQKWGLVGVALANVVAYGVEKVLQMLYLYQRYKIKPAKYLDFRWWLFYSLILLGVYWVQQM